MFTERDLAGWVEPLAAAAGNPGFFDAHTHIGHNDPDGFRSSAETLVDSLDVIGARGVVFPMHEPDGYPPANDMILEEAERSGGKLVPFCRLDPRADPLPEAERALGRGARGIKLHPRAEDFPLDTPELADVFALADERRLPILVHAGRGIPALGKHAVAVCERHPGLRLILAHAAISDLAWIWKPAGELPNLLFDTAWWAPADLLGLFALVPPGNILWASDAPYAPPVFAAHSNLRCALQTGLGEDALASIFAAQLERVLAGDDLADLGPAPGPEALDRDPLLDRVHTHLTAAAGQMFNTLPGSESLSLARLACEVGDDAPQAEVCRTVLALLDYAEKLAEAGEHLGRPERFAPGLPMVIAALTVVRTPSVPMPRLDHEPDVGERS